jgi:hypothetical protein
MKPWSETDMRNLAQCLIVVPVILASATAGAQQQKALTLSCKGTARWMPTGSDANETYPPVE